MPDLFHIIPVGDDSVFNWVFQGKDTSLGLGFITYIGVFCPIPTMTPWCLGRPTMDGKTALGASSPAKPALHMLEPLSTTKAATSSSHILDYLNLFMSVPELTTWWTPHVLCVDT